MTAPDPDLSAALAFARGAWAIIRKGSAGKLARVRRFAHPNGWDSVAAYVNDAWKKLTVRRGWAVLVDPAGNVIARQPK